MSNTNSPFGFKLLRLSEGGSVTQGNEPDIIDSAYSTPIGNGDLVIRDPTSGKIQLYVAASTVACVGIFRGCYYLNTATGQRQFANSWPGSGNTGDITCYIEEDPNGLYYGQCTLTAITQANVGENVDVTVGTPQAENVGGFSTSSVNQGSLNTTSTLPWQIQGLYSSYYGSAVNGTDNTSNYNIVVLRPNNWIRRQLTGIA